MVQALETADSVHCHLQKGFKQIAAGSWDKRDGMWQEKISFQDVPPWHALTLFFICFLSSEN